MGEIKSFPVKKTREELNAEKVEHIYSYLIDNNLKFLVSEGVDILGDKKLKQRVACCYGLLEAALRMYYEVDHPLNDPAKLVFDIMLED